MACAWHCVGTATLVHQQVQLSTARSASIKSQRTSVCEVPDVRSACPRLPAGGKLFKCSVSWKVATGRGVFRRSFLVVYAASQEASTSTLVVQEVDFMWKGQASEVLLTGDFLNWETKLPLEKGSDGLFHVKQTLRPGNYLYKFIVDGEWTHSADNPTVPDGTGSFNNQIVITETAVITPPGKDSRSRDVIDTTKFSDEKLVEVVVGTAEKESTKPKGAVPGKKFPETTVITPPGNDSRSRDAIDTTKLSDEKLVREVVGAAEKESTNQKVAVAGKVASGKAVGKVAGETAAGAKAAKKAVNKPLPVLMAEDVIPVLKSSLEKEDSLSNVDILFEDNQLQGSFAKNGVSYSFWAYFPDGNLEGSKGFSLSSHGVPPSTIEPFLIDESKINAELIVFWIKKRLFAQNLLSLN